MINRRNFFSKFSLLAFFTPFIPKLKSFLYDKNLEDKVFQKSFDFANFEEMKNYGVYLNEEDNLIYIHYLDENGNYHNEIFGSKYYQILRSRYPNQGNMLGICC